MNEKDFENYVAKIRNNISSIHNGFYVWRGLNKKDYQETFNENKYFWGIVLASLQLNWLLGIAKIFEKPRKGQEVISIPFLLEFVPEGEKKEKIKKEICKQKPILDNLWEWRRKILAHQDKAVNDNPTDFYKAYPIKGGDIESLLVSIKEILGLIRSATLDHSEIYTFRIFEEESERDDEQIIKKIEYFDREKKKHMEKIRRREIGYSPFPPSE